MALFLDNYNDIIPVRDALLSRPLRLELTFWGTRLMKPYPNDSRTIQLDVIARKLLNAGIARAKENNLSLDERIAGLTANHSIKAFYIRTDELVSSASIITRIIVFFREFSFLPFSLRWFVQHDAISKHFSSFSKEQFIEQFGDIERDGDHLGAFAEHPDARGERTNPYRIIAKEESIHRAEQHHRISRLLSNFR